jgi:hypothetical protein
MSLSLADGTHAVFADVTADFTGPPSEDTSLLVGPGILIRNATTDGRRTFYALLLQPEGYLVISWSGGVRQRVSGRLDPAELAGTVNLAARETSKGAEFFVNGESVAKVEDSSVEGNKLGLIVFGTGTFTFDNFGVNSKGEIAAPKAAGGILSPSGPAPVGGASAPAASGGANPGALTPPPVPSPPAPSN